MPDKVVICPVCGKKYGVKYIILPSKLDDKRESYYCCPYCESDRSCVNVRLLGNQEVESYKIDENL